MPVEIEVGITKIFTLLNLLPQSYNLAIERDWQICSRTSWIALVNFATRRTDVKRQLLIVTVMTGLCLETNCAHSSVHVTLVAQTWTCQWRFPPKYQWKKVYCSIHMASGQFKTMVSYKDFHGGRWKDRLQSMAQWLNTFENFLNSDLLSAK